MPKFEEIIERLKLSGCSELNDSSFAELDKAAYDALRYPDPKLQELADVYKETVCKFKNSLKKHKNSL